MQNLFNGITKVCIYLAVLLVPLWLLPFSYEVFEFNKQFLLALLVSVAFFCWIARMVLVDKELKFKKTPLDIFVAVFIFVAILSAIFSADRGSSIFGFYGRFSDGLIGLINLAVLYFLITNNIESKNHLLRTLMWSFFFVILITYLSIFGVLAKIQGMLGEFKGGEGIFKGLSLPQVMLGNGFNPVSGSMEGLAVFLAVIIVFLVTRCLIWQIKHSKLSLIINYLLLIASLVLLIIIDFTAAWIVLLVSLALFLAMALWKRMFRERAGRLMFPILLIILAGVFMLIDTAKLTPKESPWLPTGQALNLPQERVLSQGESWGIGARAAIGGVKNGFLGTGIGTFFHDFSKYKSLKWNSSELWQMRFDRPGNYISEILGTMGFLGILSYLVLIGMFLLISWMLLSLNRRETKRETDAKQLPLLMAFVALVVSQFVYYQNTFLAFAFWLILAISVVSWEKPISEKIFSLQKFPEMSLIATAILIVFGLGILGTYYFGQQFYRADMIYAKSQKMALGPERTALIEKAVKMNPNFAQYQAILARAYLDAALTEMRKPTAEQDSLALQATVAKAIDSAKAATVRGPGQVATWETLGMIYRDIRLVATGAVEWGIKSFEKAITLEPTNPVLHTELGKLLSINEPEKAKEKFAKAITLKPDYLDAAIQSALIFEREDNLEEAIRKMEDLSLEFPFNTEVLFQLGRLYFNANRIDEAISQLEKVVNFLPNHSNALYSLGIAYKEKGEKQKAISVFEKVLELNPGNQDVVKKLEELKK